MKLTELFALEYSRLPLFSPVILGIGIIFGVFFPFLKWESLISFLIIILLIFATLFYKKYNIIAFTIAIFGLGIYVAQTGGIFEISLLTQKKFIDHEYEKVTFFADVGYIDETHPTMKGMKRIVFKNIEFPENKDISFIKTAKMTCSSSVANNILPNDRIKAIGKISPYKISSIPNSFDQTQYSCLIKMDATGIVFSIKKLKESNSFDIFSYARRILTSTIMKSMGSPAGGIASALITGDKTSISMEVRDCFINSGTAHILAISGLHMSIVASILFFIFFKFSLYLSCIFHKINAKKYAAIITIPLTFLYLALSGFSPSAIRAFIMTTICLISVILGRGVFSLRSISLSAFLILLFDSGSLFLVSFQLSFCAVAALISFFELYSHKLFDFKLNSNSFLKKIYFYIFASSITTIIATASTFPVSIATFNRLSISGILGNLVAIPMTSCIIMPFGIFCLIFGPFCGFFTKILETILNFFADIVWWISSIPGSNITVKSPEIITLYIIVIGGIILCLLQTKLRHIGSGLILIGSFIWIFEEKPDIVIPPGTDAICFIQNGKFYTTSVRKGRNKILSIQRNLGFSEKLEKKEIENFKAGKKIYDRGLFIWTKSGKIMQIAKNQHPYCPAYYCKLPL